jgi:hypothetical protein
MVNWYKTLVQYAPQVFEEEAGDQNEESTEDKA